MALALASAPFSPAASSDPQGHTASSQTIDPASILQLNFATLVEATLDPVWLADQLFSEGLLVHRIKHDLETTDNPLYDKAARLWAEVLTVVTHQENPTQTLLTVCHVIKQRRELARLADSMIQQLRPQGSQQGGDDTATDLAPNPFPGGDIRIPMEEPGIVSEVDPTSIIQLYSALLADETKDPVWLADQLFSEGILDYHIKNELETTDKSSREKAIRLWSAVMTAVKHQGNPTQTLLTVCHVMKQRRELARLADSIISQLRHQGSQQGGDDTVVQMPGGLTESVLKEKGVASSPDIPLEQTHVTSDVGSQQGGDDTVIEMESGVTESVLREKDVASSTDIPLEQPSVTSDVGGDPKDHGYSSTRLPDQNMCFGIARMCYAVAMTYNILYVMHTMYGMDGTLFYMASGVLLLQFLWALVHREFKKLIAELVVTAAYFEVLVIPLLGIIRSNIVMQFPIYVEVLDYCRNDFIPLMFVFLLNFLNVSLAFLVVEETTLIKSIILVIALWYVHIQIIKTRSRVMSSLYSYAPIIIFLLIFEVFLYNRVHLSSSFKILNYLHSLPEQTPPLFFISGCILGGIFVIFIITATWLITNHPVSTDQIYWKKTWRIIVILIPLNQLFFLLLYSELPPFFIAIIVIIVIIISVILSFFSSRRVLMCVASVLIVLVLLNTIQTYKFWSVPEAELATALHGFLSQFSLVGGLFYTTAY